MRYSGITLPMLGVAVTLLFAAGSAEALRCHGDIVSKGDSTAALLKKCGEPTRTEQYDRRISRRVYDVRRDEYFIEEVALPYEIWTYNFGPTRFLTLITVEHGKILKIETSSYGY